MTLHKQKEKGRLHSNKKNTYTQNLPKKNAENNKLRNRHIRIAVDTTLMFFPPPMASAMWWELKPYSFMYTHFKHHLAATIVSPPMGIQEISG